MVHLQLLSKLAVLFAFGLVLSAIVCFEGANSVQLPRRAVVKLCQMINKVHKKQVNHQGKVVRLHPRPQSKTKKLPKALLRIEAIVKALCLKNKHQRKPKTSRIKPTKPKTTWKPTQKPPCTKHKHNKITPSRGEVFRPKTHSKETRAPKTPVTTATTLKPCEAPDCSVNAWSGWGRCSLQCGGNGVQRRTRKGVTWPACGGKCAILLEETKPCNRLCHNGGTPQGDHCKCSGSYAGQCCEKVNGGWSSWGQWSTCTSSCGGGQRFRLRHCSNPFSSNGGKQCVGHSLEADGCNEDACPSVDGDWSDWSPWSPCTRTCGTGEQVRMRACNNPAPGHGGQKCKGGPEESQKCNTRECIGGNGGSGGDKRVFPSDVIQELNSRLHRRDDVTHFDVIHDVARDDVDITSQSIIETSGEPPGTWGQWSRWSACSVTCGGGQRFRTRVCQDSVNGCHGDSIEIQRCSDQQCPKSSNL